MIAEQKNSHKNMVAALKVGDKSQQQAALLVKN